MDVLDIIIIEEMIDMGHNNKKTKQLLSEMVELNEINNKELIFNLDIISITVVLFYVEILLIASFTLEGFVLGSIIALTTMLFFLAMFFVFKIENSVGYYECKECHNRFVPDYFEYMMAPHIMKTRHLKCSKCNKKTWAKKVVTKKNG